MKYTDLIENMNHNSDAQAVEELLAALLSNKSKLQKNKNNPDKLYKLIDTMMTTVAKTHSLTGQQMHDMWVAKYKEVPDTWIMNETITETRQGACKPGDSARHGILKNVFVNEIIKMPPGSAVPLSDLVRWAYNDSIEKDANPTEMNLVKGKQSLLFNLGDHLRIFVMLEDKPIFYLGLSPYEDGYKVGVVHTEPEARGQGLGINIYTALVDQINKPIYSDTTQTNDSRLGIWQKLIDRFPDRVVGYDQKTKEDLPLTKGSYGPTVRGKEPIYAPKKGPNDRANASSTLNRTRLLKLLPASVAIASPTIETVTETRQAAWTWLKKKLPKWPDYVLRDWVYNLLRGDFPRDLESGSEPGANIDAMLKSEGLGPNTVWKLVPNFQFSLDVLNPWTIDKIKRRWGGASDAGIGVANDAARHATQKALLQKQGGIRKEPVILIKKPDGYELVEGWHRTIQHFAANPNGYVGPAWVAVASN